MYSGPGSGIWKKQIRGPRSGKSNGADNGHEMETGILEAFNEVMVFKNQRPFLGTPLGRDDDDDDDDDNDDDIGVQIGARLLVDQTCIGHVFRACVQR